MTKYERPFLLFPYGASELQAAARRLMVRGLAASSLTWMVAFAAALALGAWLTTHPAPPKTVEVRYYVRSIHEQREMVRPRDRIARTIPPSRAKEGIVVPVREEDAPEEVILPSTDRTYGVGEGEGEPDTPGALDGRALDNPPPPDEPLPNRGDPIDADELPVLVRDLKPVYPDLAREAGVEGRVIVHMLIGKDGRVMDAVIDPNNSIVMLDSSVLDAVRKLVFTPAFRNNRPVPVWVSRVYRFRLHGGTVE